MPTCALQPSQCSQFEGSQPLSQHAMSEQHSQASFGGGAPIAAHLSERSYTDSQEGANASVHLDEAQVSPVGEGEAGSDNTRQPILERDEVVDKLTKMLKMRGKSIQSDLLGVMSVWLEELGKNDIDRQGQDKTVATVEDFIRASAIRNVSDLMEVDAETRAWWPQDELDSKQEAVLSLLSTAQSERKQAGSSEPGKSQIASGMTGAPTKLATPAVSPDKTQGEMVAETPDSSLDAGRGSRTEGKVVAEKDTAMTSPRAGSAASLPSASAQGAAAASSGDKRSREIDEGSERQSEDSLDEQVEQHKNVAEKSYRQYHDLLAKRQRLMREVEGAKHLEKTRREIAKKLEKEQEARAAKDEELRQANAELEAAQKKVWAAQQAKRKQASHALALEAEMKEVLQEQKESNDRLKVHTTEFHILLKNAS